MAHWYDQIKSKFVANVANLYMEENEFDAFEIFPKVNSRQISGYIAKYSKSDWAKIGDVDDYKRAGSTESAGDDYAISSQEFTLDEYAFHKDVSKDDRNEYDNPYDPVRDAVEFVMHRLRRVLLYNVVSTMFTTSIWGTDHNETSSKWDAKTGGVSDTDPVEKVLTWQEDIEKTTGIKPNKIVMAADVLRACKLNTNITSKMKTTNDKVVTAGLLAKLFEVDKVFVANAVNSASTDYMMSGKLLLYYAPDRPSKFTPSAAYHITYKNSRSQNILTSRIPMEHLNDSLRIEGAIKTVPKIIGSDLGVYAYNLV